VDDDLSFIYIYVVKNKEQEKYMHFLWEHSHVFECIFVESEIAIITKQQKKQETLLHIHKRLFFAVSCSRPFNFLPQIICDSIFGVVRNALFYVLMCFIVYMCFILRSY
jgi:hypothetical protein